RRRRFFRPAGARKPHPARLCYHWQLVGARAPSAIHLSDAGLSPSRGTRMAIHQSVLELIGNTPIVKAQRLDAGNCELFLKLESANPGGSIKDRIGLSMIESAERAGKIKPGDILVEGTA